MAAKTDFGSAPRNYTAGAGRGAERMIGGDKDDAKAGKQAGDAAAMDTNFDSWNGSSIGLFDDAVYDQADREADDTCAPAHQLPPRLRAARTAPDARATQRTAEA